MDEELKKELLEFLEELEVCLTAGGEDLLRAADGLYEQSRDIRARLEDDE